MTLSAAALRRMLAVVPVLALVACQRGATAPGEALARTADPGQAYRCGDMRVETRWDGRNVVLGLPDAETHLGCGRFLNH